MVYKITEILGLGQKAFIAFAPDFNEAELILRQRFPILICERDEEYDGMDAIDKTGRQFSVDRIKGEETNGDVA
jgi:hypothetical protein